MIDEALRARLRTPHKLNRLALGPSLRDGLFDSHAVDCPFPFGYEGGHYMTYIGWDGIGYRTGLACSDDLLEWRRVDGRLVGTYHAYPRPGYESGPAVIGLCYADDLYGGDLGAGGLGAWELGEPVLRPDPSCAWEAGGL